MSKRVRDLCKLAERKGFRVLEAGMVGRRNVHVQLRLMTGEGEEVLALFSSSPSCPRSDLNSLSEARLQRRRT